MRDSGIYLLTIGHKKYIGQAKSFSVRWATHRRELEDGSHHNDDLQRQWNKGRKPRFAVVSHCPGWQLNGKEALWARLLSNTIQRYPRLSWTSFIPAMHPQTLVDYGLWAAVGYAIVLIVSRRL